MQSGEQHNELCFGAGDDEGCWPDTSMSGRGAAARAGCSGGGGGALAGLEAIWSCCRQGWATARPRGAGCRRACHGLCIPYHPSQWPPGNECAAPGRLRARCRAGPVGAVITQGPPAAGQPPLQGPEWVRAQPRVNLLLDTQFLDCLDTQNRAMQTCQHSTAKCQNRCIGRFKPMYQMME